MFNKIILLPRKIAALCISMYQATISPDHGLFKSKYPYGYCRHYPSCSQYTKESILKYGIFKGGFLGAWRIIKCNPWSEPVVDVVGK